MPSTTKSQLVGAPMLVTVLRPDRFMIPVGAAAASVVTPTSPAESIACAIALIRVLSSICSMLTLS